MAEAEKSKGALAAFVGGGLPADVSNDALADLLTESATEKSSSGDGVFLTFSGKQDKWTLGRDKETPDEDAIYIIEPLSVIEGWTCWKDGSPVQKHQWSILRRAQDAIPATALEDHGPYRGDSGDGWKQMLGFSMFDCDDVETRITFTTNSASGLNVVADLNKEIARRLRDGEPPIPAVFLDSEKFKAQGQWNYKPIFKVDAWLTREEVMAFLQDEDRDVDALLDHKYADDGGDPPAAEAAEEEQAAAPKEEQAAPRGRKGTKDKAEPKAASGRRRVARRSAK